MRKVFDRLWRWLWVPNFNAQMSDDWRVEHIYRSGKQ